MRSCCRVCCARPTGLPDGLKDWLYGDIDIGRFVGGGAAMATEQLLLHLPDELVRRLKRNVAPRQGSKFIQDLLEQALPPDGIVETDPLYLAALAVEEDERLAGEM